MNHQSTHNGFAIALAWPETYCKQPGSWYDPITLFLGISENNYYQVGHAAVVLVDAENKKFHYFDFGRYHAPFGHGRVRGGETDDDLQIHTIPEISEDGKEIINYREVLHELQNNISCHGEGALHASYTPVNFESAYHKAKQMQNTGPIPYGPFLASGSNCSRFVNTVIRAGRPNRKSKFKLNFQIPLTPTPISNVKSLTNRLSLAKMLKNAVFSPEKKLHKDLLCSTLPAPERHPKIPVHAQWLAGEGAGSWFAFEIKNGLVQIIRFATDGRIEFTGFYESEVRPDIRHLKITYPSNCNRITAFERDKEIHFVRKVFV